MCTSYCWFTFLYFIISSSVAFLPIHSLEFSIYIYMCTALPSHVYLHLLANLLAMAGYYIPSLSCLVFHEEGAWMEPERHSRPSSPWVQSSPYYDRSCSTWRIEILHGYLIVLSDESRPRLLSDDSSGQSWTWQYALSNYKHYLSDESRLRLLSEHMLRVPTQTPHNHTGYNFWWVAAQTPLRLYVASRGTDSALFNLIFLLWWVAA